MTIKCLCVFRSQFYLSCVSYLKQGQVSVIEVIIIHPMGVVDVHTGYFGISITYREKRV